MRYASQGGTSRTHSASTGKRTHSFAIMSATVSGLAGADGIRLRRWPRISNSGKAGERIRYIDEIGARTKSSSTCEPSAIVKLTKAI